MAKKEAKTNAMRMLETAGIAYKEHTYETEDGAIDGVSVARKCGEDPSQVFKTLVTVADTREHYVFVVPVEAKLDLKAAARAAGVKSVEMIPQKDLLKTTGYIHGKPFPTVFDETAVLYDTIMVSGGRVGVQVEVNPDDLVRITGGSYAPIARDD